MESNLLLMFSHSLTPAQLSGAQNAFGPCMPLEMPGRLKTLWQQVPADAATLQPFLAPFRQWMGANGRQGDSILIQGDFGATFLMVNHAFATGLIPVYATTRRTALETRHPDGTVKLEHIFEFCRFRKYGE